MIKSFVGILFCGGRGVRLGKITEYISKAFVPVYDRPAFMYPLAQLEASKIIDEIVILTNEENDAKLRETGYRTIIQDNAQVHDMFSGLEYIRKVTGDDRSAVLMPCDNISTIMIDDVLNVFIREEPDIAFNIRKLESRPKLCQMGVFDPATGRMEYKPPKPKSHWGVIAPYIVRGELNISGSTAEVMNRSRLVYVEYEGLWFDIGDAMSLALANWTMSSRLGRLRLNKWVQDSRIELKPCSAL